MLPIDDGTKYLKLNDEHCTLLVSKILQTSLRASIDKLWSTQVFVAPPYLI